MPSFNSIVSAFRVARRRSGGAELLWSVLPARAPTHTATAAPRESRRGPAHRPAQSRARRIGRDLECAVAPCFPADEWERGSRLLLLDAIGHDPDALALAPALLLCGPLAGNSGALTTLPLIDSSYLGYSRNLTERR